MGRRKCAASLSVPLGTEQLLIQCEMVLSLRDNEKTRTIAMLPILKPYRAYCRFNAVGLVFEATKAPGLPTSSDYKYNHQFIEQNEFTDATGNLYGLNWYDFEFRTYDPQLGLIRGVLILNFRSFIWVTFVVKTRKHPNCIFILVDGEIQRMRKPLNFQSPNIFIPWPEKWVIF